MSRPDLLFTTRPISTGACKIPPLLIALGQDERRALCDGHGMLIMSGQSSVGRYNCPIIIQYINPVGSSVDHGLNGNGHAGPQHVAGVLPAVVGHRGILVELPTDAVARQGPNHRIAVVLHIFLDGVANIPNLIARDAQLQAYKEGFPGSGDKILRLRIGLPHHEGVGSVAVESSQEVPMSILTRSPSMSTRSPGIP